MGLSLLEYGEQIISEQIVSTLTPVKRRLANDNYSDRIFCKCMFSLLSLLLPASKDDRSVNKKMEVAIIQLI